MYLNRASEKRNIYSQFTRPNRKAPAERHFMQNISPRWDLYDVAL